MKVRIVVTVDLKDPQQWTDTFGVEGARAVHADVKQYVGNGVQGLGAFGNGEIDADIDWT